MDRRQLLATAGALAAAPGFALAARTPFRRVRPGEAGWPSTIAWAGLSSAVGGRLVKVTPPFAACMADPKSDVCAALFKNLRNPYFIGDDVALTQTLGYTDAWTSEPSAYAVEATSAADVAAAVKFANAHKLRLVVKGGGHSYLGTSNAADSLLVWTRAMHDITLHDAFVAKGCEGKLAPQHAVTVGSGAIWKQAYDAVTTRGGRYVQGGGCYTVGVAGLIQSGGFGSFSKTFGTAASSLLEAEVVTADGEIRIANPCTNPDLFWAIKGGGGGTFGIVTRLTLRTHDLPENFGTVQGRIEAKTIEAYRRLVAHTVEFYRSTLMTPHWGEQIRFSGHAVSIYLLFQGMDQKAAQTIWAPYFDWVKAQGDDYLMKAKPFIIALPARKFWDASFMGPLNAVIQDDRPGAPTDNTFWRDDAGQVGQVLHGYHSVWLPKSLLHPDQQGRLVDALLSAAATWGVSLHFNKGLAGAPDAALAASRDTATNPAVLDAFALAITAGEEPPAYPGVPGHEPHDADGRADAKTMRAAMEALKALAPSPASYVSESDYFDPSWRTAYWGENAARLERIKARYDPDGLFFVHHGIGSERWSPDGFVRLG